MPSTSRHAAPCCRKHYGRWLSVHHCPSCPSDSTPATESAREALRKCTMAVVCAFHPSVGWDGVGSTVEKRKGTRCSDFRNCWRRRKFPVRGPRGCHAACLVPVRHRMPEPIGPGCLGRPTPSHFSRSLLYVVSQTAVKASFHRDGAGTIYESFFAHHLVMSGP